MTSLAISVTEAEMLMSVFRGFYISLTNGFCDFIYFFKMNTYTILLTIIILKFLLNFFSNLGPCIICLLFQELPNSVFLVMEVGSIQVSFNFFL